MSAVSKNGWGKTLSCLLVPWLLLSCLLVLVSPFSSLPFYRCHHHHLCVYSAVSFCIQVFISIYFTGNQEGAVRATEMLQNGCHIVHAKLSKCLTLTVIRGYNSIEESQNVDQLLGHACTNVL